MDDAGEPISTTPIDAADDDAVLYPAAVARRRIRLTTQQPIQVLSDIIGVVGSPPRDQSYNFAVIAIVLLVLSWIVVPPIVWAVFLR